MTDIKFLRWAIDACKQGAAVSGRLISVIDALPIGSSGRTYRVEAVAAQREFVQHKKSFTLKLEELQAELTPLPPKRTADARAAHQSASRFDSANVKRLLDQGRMLSSAEDIASETPTLTDGKPFDAGHRPFDEEDEKEKP